MDQQKDQLSEVELELLEEGRLAVEAQQAVHPAQPPQDRHNPEQASAQAVQDSSN